MRDADLLEKPSRGEDCPSARELEAMAVARGPAPGKLASHVAGCVECGGYVAEVRIRSRQFVQSRPAARFLRQLDARETQRGRASARRRWFWALGPLAIAASVGLLVVRSEGVGVVPSLRLKGQRLQAFYLRPGMPAPLPVTPDSELRAGDNLRFVYRAPEAGELVILDVDGSGEPTVFYPYGATRAGAVLSGDPSPLPGSIELDATPGPELLIAVFSRDPLDLSELLRQLRGKSLEDAAKLHCRGCVVETPRIRKRP